MKSFLTLALLIIATLSINAQQPPPPAQAPGLRILARMDTPPCQSNTPMSKLVVGLLVLAALGMRMSGVRRAHAMATQERAAYSGREMSFRAFHEGGADH
jgi:hypothetical protein